MATQRYPVKKAAEIGPLAAALERNIYR